MTIKQKVLKAVQSLPAKASMEDVIDQLLFLAKIEKGLTQANSNQSISHSKAKAKMSKWFK
ncbi:MAG: hypothetical protein ACKVQC_09560 [Elusimicrobiota bacterium]